ncbi:YifB family Mg chelatase-like AAA ATPase [Akkermansia sp.]|uniref:YifB family Mg chelatase-like AAA ATPase n=1 Tax=Akkermansia sp. TaxID=1872421 RepID=UPI0025BBC61F|nr:YifB family Mg chelatase-like AAA ATPase [Akkermansia sp.]MCD8063657.1 YifB family Mg chelatase-like AAA ATPase [Akkermansia sp.]
MGELALDGAVRPVQGILPQIMEARRMGRKRIMLPRANAHEGTPVQGVEIYPVASLKEAWELLTSSVLPPPFTASGREGREAEDKEAAVDFDEIKGQPYARRAMEIAAAGGHNILLCGSPGSGKSMLAQRLPTILPPLTPEEALETSKIHSVCGLLKRGNGLVARRPFRAPHHTISDAGLMGGGANITPGEVSLAHNGVLFLDELPEFRRAALETLRQPLEAGQVVISRASGTMTFPCRFMLAAAMNPCPCGYLGDRRRTCTCPPAQVARYRRKISGPLLDRFDLLMEVPAVDPAILASAPAGECSAGIRARVMAARQLQRSRYAGTPFRSNAALSGKALQRHCRLLPEGRAILLRAVEELALSARAYDRILKVARTIADLEGSPDIQDPHLYEAVQYRAFEHSLRE